MVSRPETEPNNTVMMRQAPTATSVVYAGSLGAMDTMDCFGITVPAMGSVFLETNLPMAPTCPTGGADTIVTLYNPAGMQIAEVDDTLGRGLCSTIDPSTTAAARGLAAGSYTACVRLFNTVAAPSYTLTVGVYGP
jgi:hypothetical protein